MKVNIPKGGLWVIIATIVLETADVILRFGREHRLRREMEKEDEVRESKNWILKRCLDILQKQQEEGR